MIDRCTIAGAGMLLPGRHDPVRQRAYEHAVQGFFGAGTAFTFWKGRVALYAILKALRIGPGDEVIVPGYTCVMVPGPVLYAGAKPVYADIELDCYGVQPDAVARKITPRTRAILAQHTYGLPAPVNALRRIADQHGIALIEDCCHTFGGRLNGQLLGTFGQAAFFSGQWNKPFSTGLGGLALLHDEELAQRVRLEQDRCANPPRKAAFMLASQLLAYEMVVYPSTTAMITRLFRWLTRKGLVVGSSSKAEFDVVMPKNYALAAAPVQCRLGRLEVERIEANLTHRRQVAARYFEELPKLGYAVPKLPKGADVPILRFPLRVANKAGVLAQAAAHGVEIGSWFECPLHPWETNQAAFGYRDGDCPVAEKAAREVINLPTHRRVSARDIEKTLKFVRTNCRPASAP